MNDTELELAFSLPFPSKARDSRLEVITWVAHKRTREPCDPERFQQDIAEHKGLVIGIHRIKRSAENLGYGAARKRNLRQ